MEGHWDGWLMFGWREAGCYGWKSVGERWLDGGGWMEGAWIMEVKGALGGRVEGRARMEEAGMGGRKNWMDEDGWKAVGGRCRRGSGWRQRRVGWKGFG